MDNLFLFWKGMIKLKETIIIGIGVILILFIIWLVLKLCHNFRDKVYHLFLKAEKFAKKGQKMDYVVENIYPYIPSVIKIFVSESSLRWLLQKMFDVVSDFLNDGKVNGK